MGYFLHFFVDQAPHSVETGLTLVNAVTTKGVAT